MKERAHSEDTARAREYSAQPTAPSEQSAKKRSELGLGITWFGPSGTLDSTLGAADVLRIGREPSNDLVLSGTEVSRKHATITRTGDSFTLADLGSRNGVLVNGRQTPRSVLSEGMVLRLGDWIGTVHRGGGGPLRELMPRLWGSARLSRALDALRVAAESALNLIVLGETGTGKELVARAVFDWSGLQGAFVPVNCAAFSENLVEAELFGHARGAFTGAVAERLGHVREADGGLLFLDEIGEMSLSAQSKLLRVVQEQEVTPVGTSQRIPVRVRVMAATHQNLRDLVKTGAFRADLLARLEGLVVRLPPLRERREDVVPLFLHFVRAQLGKAPPLTPELALALTLHDWPGNARELKQLADRAAVLHGQAPRFGLDEVELPTPESARPLTPSPAVASDTPALPRKGRVGPEELTQALAAADGVVAAAARHLGISKQTLYKLIGEHGVDVKQYRQTRRGQ